MFDREKFKRLVHYIVWKAGHRDGFGATKLNKVLWFADARTYVLTGEPITGATYIRQKYGPVARETMPIRAELEHEGTLRVISAVQKYDRTVFRAKTRPDTSLFSRDELKTVDYWIDHIADQHTAKSISEMSHDYAWDIARMGEELPLHAFLASRIRDLDEAEEEVATQRAKEIGIA